MAGRGWIISRFVMARMARASSRKSDGIKHRDVFDQRPQTHDENRLRWSFVGGRWSITYREFLMEVRFRVHRYDPDVDVTPRYQIYSVAVEEGSTVLDCLNQIKWY